MELKSICLLWCFAAVDVLFFIFYFYFAFIFFYSFVLLFAFRHSRRSRKFFASYFGISLSCLTQFYASSGVWLVDSFVGFNHCRTAWFLLVKQFLTTKCYVSLLHISKGLRQLHLGEGNCNCWITKQLWGLLVI